MFSDLSFRRSRRGKIYEHVTSLKGKAEVWTEGLWRAEVRKALCFPFNSSLNGLTFH